jgi:hypothetical protein
MYQSELNYVSGNRAYLNQAPGDGINAVKHPLHIGDAEASLMYNLCSKSYPSLSTRPVRQQFKDLTTPLNRKTFKVWVSQENEDRKPTIFEIVRDPLLGVVWRAYFDADNGEDIDVISREPSEVAYPYWQMEHFNTGTDKYVICCGSSPNKSDKGVHWMYRGGHGVVLFDESKLEYCHSPVAHKNRLFWARGNQLIFSALNNITDYTTVNDAGIITIAQAKGDITALVSFNNALIVFTSSEIYYLMGSTPTEYADTYSIVKVEGGVGCRSREEICVTNKRVYWMAHDGIYEMSAGGSPVKISEPFYNYGQLANGVTGGIRSYLYGNNSIVAPDVMYTLVGYNERLFVIPRVWKNSSIPSEGFKPSGDYYYVFDINYRKWHIEKNNGYFTASSAYEIKHLDYNNLFLADNEKIITTWGYKSPIRIAVNDPPDFEFVSKMFYEGNISQDCTLDEIWIYCDLYSGSFQVHLITGDEEITLLAKETNESTLTDTVTAGDESFRMLRYIVPEGVKPKGCYQIAISGIADLQIHLIERHIRKIGD